jgi:carboxyl-terminal processing protease
MKIMRRIILFILLIATSTVSFAGSIAKEDSTKLMPEPRHAKEAMLITQLLEIHHYRKMKFSDSLSSAILDSYINVLDPGKSYFLASDIVSFEALRYELGKQTVKGNVQPAYDIFHLFNERYTARMSYINEVLLKTSFDYSKNEMQDVDRTDNKWSSSEKELNDIWRKIVKNQKLSLILNDKTEDEINEIINKRYKRYLKTISQYKSDDIFQLYMNVVSEAFDPHTNYFSKHTSDNFKINMSLSLEGIGATLQTVNDYTKVNRVVPGGPADKSGLIHGEDKIIAVGQGEVGEMQDIIGWRIDDVVALIRGPKGTKVRLEILPAVDGVNGKAELITIVREKVKLEDKEAQKEIIPMIKNGKQMTMGVIKLPSFYFGWEDYQKGDENYSSTTKDVRRLIEELSTENIDGLVIDLRNNGGGSLSEAIDLTGLFIDNGPVVQVKPSDPRRAIEVGRDTLDGVAYDGPMMVLINRFSASASEIFAGAIQDYKRGVVVGEQTFGKGTVQSVVDLGRFMPEAKDETGQLKLTLQKFYRVTGSSTQHKGVSPDINLPSAFSAEDFGESAEPSALPWDEVASTDFEATNDVSIAMIAKLKKVYEYRLKTDKGLQQFVEETKAFEKNLKLSEVSLNQSERQSEIDRIDKLKKSTDLSTTIVNKETGATVTDELNIDDQYLKEGILILAELITGNIG